jgi:hypothetical protein
MYYMYVLYVFECVLYVKLMHTCQYQYAKMENGATLSGKHVLCVTVVVAVSLKTLANSST